MKQTKANGKNPNSASGTMGLLPPMLRPTRRSERNWFPRERTTRRDRPCRLRFSLQK